MNAESVKRLLKLADWLDAGAPHKHVKFKMEVYLCAYDKDGNWSEEPENVCHTTCCIAGAAVQFFAPKDALHLLKHPVTGDHFGLGVKALGITPDQGGKLFFGPCGTSMHQVTAKQAGRVVRHFAETGEVDWSVAKRGWRTRP